MKYTILSAAIAAVLAAPAGAVAASDADIAGMRQALESVNRRLDALEQQNQALGAKNRQLEEKNAKLEEANDKQTDQIAQARAKASSSDWASKVTWKGDLRYRHESVDPEEAVTDQLRHRIRARFGLTAKATDTLSGTVQLATNGGNGDPRSTNQTLGSGFDRKGVGIDLAYVDWKAAEGVNLLLGKMPQPFQKVADYFYDGDITPEGAALRFARGSFFASVYGFWLQESATASDANVLGAQVGIKQKLGDTMTVTGALGYYDVGAVQNEVTFAAAPCTVAVNNAFFGGSATTPANGNRVSNVGGCRRLLNDFNVFDVLGQVDLKLGSLPFSVFAQYAQNRDADDQDTAYAGGFTLGRASDPLTWELGYTYQKTEADALFGQFVDSDFGGGFTDSEGSVFKVGFAPTKNWVINGTYFMNDRFIDNPIAVGGVPTTSLGYDRYQIDFNVRY